MGQTMTSFDQELYFFCPSLLFIRKNHRFSIFGVSSPYRILTTPYEPSTCTPSGTPRKLFPLRNCIDCACKEDFPNKICGVNVFNPIQNRRCGRACEFMWRGHRLLRRVSSPCSRHAKNTRGSKYIR